MFQFEYIEVQVFFFTKLQYIRSVTGQETINKGLQLCIQPNESDYVTYELNVNNNQVVKYTVANEKCTVNAVT